MYACENHTGIIANIQRSEDVFCIKFLQVIEGRGRPAGGVIVTLIVEWFFIHLRSPLLLCRIMN